MRRGGLGRCFSQPVQRACGTAGKRAQSRELISMLGSVAGAKFSSMAFAMETATASSVGWALGLVLEAAQLSSL